MITIVGTGQALGSEVITNEELSEQLGVTADWIFSRTGIRQRKMASSNECLLDLAVKASLQALQMANISAEMIDLIICCAMFPEQPLPSTACLIQAKLGATNAVAFDLTAACSGFLFGLETAKNFALSGNYKNILVIGADLMTRNVNYQDCHTSILFADGAGAVVLSNTNPNHGILAINIYTDGRNADLIKIKAGGTKLPASCQTVTQKLHFMEMQGREIFKLAVAKMSQSCLEILEKTNLTIDQIKMVIPHQANQRITEAVAHRLNIPLEKIYSNIESIGNSGSATIPICIDECWQKRLIGHGVLILLTAFGSGTTWGSCLFKF